MEWIGPTILKNQPVRDFRHSIRWLQPKLTFVENVVAKYILYYYLGQEPAVGQEEATTTVSYLHGWQL